MFLVELVMQGVRGFRELARLRFQSGFNFIAAGNESGKTTAVDSIRRLLFPRNQSAAFDALVSRQTPDASRGALVVHSDENAYFRIIQDFSKRAVNLSRYNTVNKDFSLLHKDWESSTQFMAEITAGIAEEDFARIFILHREHFAAHRAPQVSGGVPAAAPRMMTGRPVSSPRLASADNSRLVELREILRKAEEAADADYKFQSAKLAQDEIRKKIAAVEDIEEKRSGMESTLESLKACAELPENYSELIEEHERRQNQKAVDVDEIHKQIEGLRMQLEGIPTVNLITDKLFIGGTVVGVLAILAGVFVLTEELAFIFPLGVLLSLILMAGAWYNGARKGSQRKKIGNEIADLQEDLTGIEKRFQQEGSIITSAMRSVGAATTGELKEKADNYRYFLSLQDEIKEQRQRVLADTSPEALRQQYEQLQQDAVALEQAAHALAKNNVDTYSIRQEIERLDSENSASSGDMAWDPGSGVQDFPADFADPNAGGGHTGFLGEMQIASRISGIEMDTLIPAVEAAAQRNLTTVTAGRYVRIEAGHEGDPVVHAKDDSVVNYAELSHGTKGLIYFCLRTGLVEAIAGKRRIPFILDDPLAGFDPARQKAACQILRALGAKTQVILFTSNSALKADGDAAAELK